MDKYWKSRTIKYDAIKLIVAALPVLLFGILCSMSQIILIMDKGESSTVSVSQIAMALGVFGVIFAIILMIWASIVAVSDTKLKWRTRTFVVIGFAMVAIFSVYCASVQLKWQAEAIEASYFVAVILLALVLFILCYMLYFGKKMMDVKDNVRDQEAVELQRLVPRGQRSSSMVNPIFDEDEGQYDTGGSADISLKQSVYEAKASPQLKTPDNTVRIHGRNF